MQNSDNLHSQTFFIEEAFLERTDLIKNKESLNEGPNDLSHSVEIETQNQTPQVGFTKTQLIMQKEVGFKPLQKENSRMIHKSFQNLQLDDLEAKVTEEESFQNVTKLLVQFFSD